MKQIAYAEYLDRVYGGWLGKCIGGTAGAKQENNKNVMHYTAENAFPEQIPPNDDLDLQVLWLEDVLLKKGLGFTSLDLAESFAAHNLCLANEYAVAIKNVELGIRPPLSGQFNNDFFKNSMGCPIRSEIWGFLCPGSPAAAVRFAGMDGCIDHEIESISGEQFYAALEAMAFFEQDRMTLVENALAYVPANTELKACVSLVLEAWRSGLDWAALRQKLVRRFGSGDASYSVVNVGLTIMALLYGNGDFTQTLLYAVNGGFDTDCTAATAVAILGVIIGAKQVPAFWKDKVGDALSVGTIDIPRTSDSIAALALETCVAGLSFAQAGLLEIEIADVPATVQPILPPPPKPAEVEIEVIYPGLPSIGCGETTGVIVKIANRSDRVQSGGLIVVTPHSLASNLETAGLNIAPKSEVCLPLQMSIPETLDVLPQKNISHLAFVQNEQVTAACDFGLSGAARAKLIGPFWDNYDTRRYASDPYGDLRQTVDGHFDLMAMFNSFVNVEREYIDESFAGLDALDGIYVNFHHDRLELDQYVHYQGPCCVYLVQDLVCPEERPEVECFVGHNDAFKLWINGDLVCQSRDHAAWMPYNEYAIVKFHPGVNRIVSKVVRSGERFGYSCLFRDWAHRAHWFTDLGYLLVHDAK